MKYDGGKPFHSHSLRYGFTFNRINVFAFASFFGIQPQIFSQTSFTPPGTVPGPDGQAASNPGNYPVQLILFGNGQGAFTEKPAFGSPAGGLGDKRFEAYLGDSWKAKSNLTITYGVHYGRDTGRNDADLAPDLPSSRD